MKLNPYLIFDGQCEAAFSFCQKCLGGSIEAMMPFRNSPASNEVPADARDRIMHARLDIGDQALMGSDTTPQHLYDGMRGIHVSIDVDGPEDAERIYAALAEGGTVQMPLQQTFWADRLGMVVDRFGTPWIINSPPASWPAAPRHCRPARREPLRGDPDRLVQVARLDQRQPRLRTIALRHRDRPVQRDDRRRIGSRQHVIQPDDLRPVGFASRWRLGMDGRDRGLQRIGSDAPRTERLSNPCRHLGNVGPVAQPSLNIS